MTEDKNDLTLPDLKIRISVLLLLAVCFCVLTGAVINDGIAAFESGVYTALSRFINPGNTRTMIFITNMGSSTAIIAVTGILLVLPLTRKAFGLPVAFNTVLGAGITLVLKNLIARERPDILWLVTESGYGFPSGHTLNSTALCAVILFTMFRQTKRKIRMPALIVLTAIPLLIGVSRMYLGVHNAGDILGGLIMGVMVALAVDTLFQYNGYLKGK